MENERTIFQTAETLKDICKQLRVGFVFKSSFDKANRSSVKSYRGPGINEGLKIFQRLKKELRVPILTDIHEPWQAKVVAEVVDILQIPAFLCRQTDIITQAAKTNKPINIKKGQFMAPDQMKPIVQKAFKYNNRSVILTERGFSFGYHDLVVDFRSIKIMKDFGLPVIFDATHSVQSPGGIGESTGGNREFVAPLARAAAAVGIDGLFFEVHPNPDNALSDGPNMIVFEEFERILSDVVAIDSIIRNPA